MKPLSDRARDAIVRLHEGYGLAARVLGRPHWNLSAIEELSRCGEPAAIPFIVPVLISGTRQQVLLAGQAIHTLLRNIPADDLASLDELMRRSWYGEYGQAWRRLEPRALAKWVGPGEPGNLLLQLSSFHGNGFVREEAIRRLNLVRDGSELPYLLLRLNDWVPEVRNAARAAVLDRLTPDHTDAFVKAIPVIVRLQEARRTTQSEILEGIAHLLAGPAARESMVAAMGNSSRQIRRCSFQFLITCKPDELPQILLAAFRVADPVIRLWAARAAASSLHSGQLRQVLNTLARDPSAPVRQQALRAWVGSFPSEAADHLMAGLLDRNGAVRAEARHHLNKTTNVDFAEHYRDALANGKGWALVAAMSGLAETGGLVDAERFVPYLSHPITRVRRAAVRNLMLLDGHHYFDMVAERLLDASPSVSAQAAKVLEPYAARLGATELWMRLERSGLDHVRKNLLRIVAALPKWESIEYLLRATGEHDEVFTERARHYVSQWDAQYNRTQTAPTGDQVARINVELSNAEARLPSSTVGSLRFAIASFAPR